MHFIGNPADKTVYVTEGALKADIAYSFCKKTFVALVGVSNYRALEPIFAQLKRNGVENIVEAIGRSKRIWNPSILLSMERIGIRIPEACLLKLMP